MVSTETTMQDRGGGAQSNGVLPAVNQISSDVSANCVKDVYAPKVRKPYTITKQRERWTEDEHKKFIEALQLHGRCWQRIEEHVGTKTAVQIRSHAQKFFSKVVRESSGSDQCSMKPIDIPPPRPKRKPMHPYPRKLIASINIVTGALGAEEVKRSSSSNLSVSEEENRSPTSVLPALESEISGATDSNSPKGSPSPVSSALGVNHGSSVISEPNLFLEEALSAEEQVPLKLELFPEESALSKEGPAEGASTCSLKLFGKTFFVAGFGTSTTGTSQSSPLAMEGQVNALQGDSVPTEISARDAEGSWPSLVQWNFHGGMQIPIFPQEKLVVMTKANQTTVSAQTQNGNYQNGGSLTCSITKSVNADVNGEKIWPLETKNACHLPFCKVENGRNGCQRGFVPYKRCLAARESQSSIILSEEREDQRIRLYL
ncbi:hypothetical protein NMG60_11026504 [Bertholletia excelsa]